MDKVIHREAPDKKHASPFSTQFMILTLNSILLFYERNISIFTIHDFTFSHFCCKNSWLRHNLGGSVMI